MTTYQDIQHGSEQNLLLQMLSEPAARNLLAHMDLVLLPIGKILHEPGILVRHAYFPTTCVVSLLCGVESGSTTQVSFIGKEGMVGAMNIASGETSPIQAVVQSTGYAYRIRAAVLRDELQTNLELQTLLVKYVHTLMSQMAQTAACIRHHTVEQQLCSWFLHCLDRLPSNELLITQEFISHMLGVRREGVTAAAGKLQKAGIISYRRGRISIIDRAGLEASACECYDLIRKENQRIMPAQEQPAAPQPMVVNNWSSEAQRPKYASNVLRI